MTLDVGLSTQNIFLFIGIHKLRHQLSGTTGPYAIRNEYPHNLIEHLIEFQWECTIEFRTAQPNLNHIVPENKFLITILKLNNGDKIAPDQIIGVLKKRRQNTISECQFKIFFSLHFFV